VIKHVKPVSRRSATGKTARVYEQMRREFGVHAEPIALHSPAPEVMFGVWSLCRETLVAPGRVRRAAKETVAAAVSSINRCPFCVDAHAAMLAASGHYATARKLDQGRYGAIAEPELAAVVDWAVATRSPDAEILRDPPFDRRQAPELIGTAMLFHYINRPVNVFLSETPFPTGARLLKGGMVRIAGRRFREVVNHGVAPGVSLELLPDAPLPEDMSWARGSPIIAGVWARFAAAVERAGQAALAPEVRALVAERLASWKGEDPGLGVRWLEDSLTGLAEELRPEGRLALLTALASYRIDETVIADFRDGRPDSELVAAVSWSALAAARRIGSWLSRGMQGEPSSVHPLRTPDRL
jgi:AhpD family alkylhydroperoxidase